MHRVPYPWYTKDTSKDVLFLPLNRNEIFWYCKKEMPFVSVQHHHFAETVVLKEFHQYKEQVSVSRRYIFWALRSRVGHDVAKKIALVYTPKPYEGWCFEDYERWLQRPSLRNDAKIFCDTAIFLLICPIELVLFILKFMLRIFN